MTSELNLIYVARRSLKPGCDAQSLFPGTGEAAIPVTQHCPPTPPREASERHEASPERSEPVSQVSRNR